LNFDRVSLKALEGELAEIPVTGRDALSDVIDSIMDAALKRLGEAGSADIEDAIATVLQEDRNNLDVIRLFTGQSQDVIAHELGAALGVRGGYSAIKRVASVRFKEIAKALVEIGVDKVIREHLARQWTLREVLLDRYKMSRGRAIAGQQRGQALEKEVQLILDELKVPYVARRTFEGREGKRAKADFAIPNAANPKIIIEVKAFEGTGSKQTDVLGDISKIREARQRHQYFFVVTNGRGWRNRSSDLRELVRLQNIGEIDMIYTRARLPELAQTVQHIMTHEV
jgi:hypothetical protein